MHQVKKKTKEVKIDGSVQDCSISSALAMEILLSCTKPSKCMTRIVEVTAKQILFSWKGDDFETEKQNVRSI